MGGPLAGALLLLLFLLAPAAPKPALSPEARRLAQTLAGWDWPEDASSLGQGNIPGSVPGDDSDDSEQRSWEIVPLGPAAHKRALSVLSRFTPFTSLGRRISRYPARSRGAGTRDYISAETRGDFSDRPSGQPLRWGR